MSVAKLSDKSTNLLTCWAENVVKIYDSKFLWTEHEEASGVAESSTLNSSRGHKSRMIELAIGGAIKKARIWAMRRVAIRLSVWWFITKSKEDSKYIPFDSEF